MKSFVLTLVVIFALWPTAAQAQLYGNRLASRDGKWLLPVATLHLGSTEADHIRRGSVQSWDLIAPYGSVVYPIASGVVEYAGGNNKGGYGTWLFIRHAGGVHTIMAHCIADSLFVRTGDTVTQWTPVCRVGWTGKTSFGPHTHLEIHKASGGRYNISDFFDINAMKYQKLGNAASKEIVTKVGIVTANGKTQNVASSTVGTLSLPSIPLPMLLVTFAFFLLLSGLYIFAGRSELLRHSIFHGMALYVSVMTLVMVAGFPASSPITADQQSVTGSAMGGNAWELAYKQAAKWEGVRCVHDPSRTMRGVTQGTFNAYRKSKGLPQADVCGIAEQEAKAIYYERYWVPSGAGTLPAALAMTHYDMAVNAGIGVAKRILAQCGNNVGCYNNQREVFYKGARGCSAYCAGWLSRLRDMRKVTEQ